MRIVFSLILAALLFTGCAPTATGSSGLFPIQLDDPSKVATVQAGKRTYVAVRYAGAAFGFSRGDYDKIFDFNFDSPQDGEREVYWLQHKSSDVPEGWQANMHAVRAVRNIDSRNRDSNSTTVYFYNRVLLVYAIEIPNAAVPGRYDLTVTVKDNLQPSSTKEFNTTVRVNVVAPQ
jgi:hypothetical protein